MLPEMWNMFIGRSSESCKYIYLPCWPFPDFFSHSLSHLLIASTFCAHRIYIDTIWLSPAANDRRNPRKKLLRQHPPLQKLKPRKPPRYRPPIPYRMLRHLRCRPTSMRYRTFRLHLKWRIPAKKWLPAWPELPALPRTIKCAWKRAARRLRETEVCGAPLRLRTIGDWNFWQDLIDNGVAQLETPDLLTDEEARFLGSEEGQDLIRVSCSTPSNGAPTLTAI